MGGGDCWPCPRRPAWRWTELNLTGEREETGVTGLLASPGAGRGVVACDESMINYSLFLVLEMVKGGSNWYLPLSLCALMISFSLGIYAFFFCNCPPPQTR